ncbi:MAG TPA: DUF397 domain-containing protein [Streptosporangiaceae bacterium]
MSSPLDLSGATWRKAGRSSGGGNECVEVAAVRRVIAVRDSKNPTGAALAVPHEQWRSFTERVKSGRYDL